MATATPAFAQVLSTLSRSSRLPMSIPEMCPFSPSVFSVQLFLDRISSPWEDSFAGANQLDVRFLSRPSHFTSPSSPPSDGQIRVGTGKLFFVRGDQMEWMEFGVRKSGEGEPMWWSGGISREQTMANHLPLVKSLVCEMRGQNQASPPIFAHLLLSVHEVERRMDGERGKVGTSDGWAQTEQQQEARKRNNVGMQTEEQEPGADTKAVARGERRALVRLILLMAFRDRAKQKEEWEKRVKDKVSKATLTHISIPPGGLPPTSPRRIQMAAHCRARIAYLSALYRTMVVPAESAIKTKKREDLRNRHANGEEIFINSRRIVPKREPRITALKGRTDEGRRTKKMNIQLPFPVEQRDRWRREDGGGRKPHSPDDARSIDDDGLQSVALSEEETKEEADRIEPVNVTGEGERRQEGVTENLNGGRHSPEAFNASQLSPQLRQQKPAAVSASRADSSSSSSPSKVLKASSKSSSSTSKSSSSSATSSSSSDSASSKSSASSAQSATSPKGSSDSRTSSSVRDSSAKTDSSIPVEVQAATSASSSISSTNS